MIHNFITPDARRKSLREVITSQHCIRVLESHSALSALIGQTVSSVNDGRIHYNAFWSSSLTDSTIKGKPDIELLSISDRMSTINEIFEVTTLPMIVDGDTGGRPEHFAYHVRTLERFGVSAVIIEDKTGLKKNSLFGNEVSQQQDSIEDFCNKIRVAKTAQVTPEFLVIARVESLILDAGMDDALKRASAYVAAGADGIMIHSRKKDGSEIINFAKNFRASHPGVIMVCVPTSYSHIHFDELKTVGFNVVIYANHMLRASYLAMKKVAENILRDGRTQESEPDCLGIDEILNLIPGTK